MVLDLTGYPAAFLPSMLDHLNPGEEAIVAPGVALPGPGFSEVRHAKGTVIRRGMLSVAAGWKRWRIWGR